jgi:hypothetical protein
MPTLNLAGERLEIHSAGVGSAAENNNAAVFVIDERLQRVVAEVRTGRRGIKIIIFKKAAGISAGGITDIAAFGIYNDRDITADIISGAFQGVQACITLGFIKGDIRLIGAY